MVSRVGEWGYIQLLDFLEQCHQTTHGTLFLSMMSTASVLLEFENLNKIPASIRAHTQTGTTFLNPSLTPH